MPAEHSGTLPSALCYVFAWAAAARKHVDQHVEQQQIVQIEGSGIRNNPESWRRIGIFQGRQLLLGD